MRPPCQAGTFCVEADRQHGRDRVRAQVAGSQARLADQARPALEPVGARLGPRGDHLDQLVADEPERRAVLGRVAVAHAVEQVLVERRAAVALAVVDRVRVREEPERRHPVHLAVVSADRLGEPAERAGAEAAHDDAGLPRLAQDLVDAVGAPDAEQAQQAAAADVDHVLGHQVRAHVRDAALAAEERDVGGLRALAEGAVEAHEVVVGVAAGRRQEADLRLGRPGQAHHVVVEQRVARLHREPTASERDYLLHPHHLRLASLNVLPNFRRRGAPHDLVRRVRNCAVARSSMTRKRLQARGARTTRRTDRTSGSRSPGRRSSRPPPERPPGRPSGASARRRPRRRAPLRTPSSASAAARAREPGPRG